MNISLWTLQVLLALHTLMGAVWKFKNPEQSVGSLKAMPHSVWLGMSVLELFCVVGLVIPALVPSLGMVVPLAAGAIALEMLVCCGVHLGSGNKFGGPMFYWLVVAAVCAFLAYGRTVLSVIQA